MDGYERIQRIVEESNIWDLINQLIPAFLFEAIRALPLDLLAGRYGVVLLTPPRAHDTYHALGTGLSAREVWNYQPNGFQPRYVWVWLGMYVNQCPHRKCNDSESWSKSARLAKSARDENLGTGNQFRWQISKVRKFMLQTMVQV